MRYKVYLLLPVFSVLFLSIFEKVKDGIKKVAGKVEDSAEKVVDPDTYTGSDDEKVNRQNEKGGKEPMNPEDITEHEPTAVKRDKNQESSGDPV